MAIRTRTVAIALEVTNDGSAPASDVDVHVHVHDAVEVNEDGEPAEPERPNRPAKPRTSAEILHEQMRIPALIPPNMHRDFPDFSRAARGPANVSALSTEKSNSFDVRCHVGPAKHHQTIALPVFYLVLPEAGPIRPLQLEYTVNAAEMPEPLRGRLNLVMRTP